MLRLITFNSEVPIRRQRRSGSRHLGAEFVRSSGRLQARRINVFIATVVDGDGVGKPPVAPYQGLDHFGLKVEDADAVAASAKRALLSRPNPPQSVPGFRVCFIRGPQGVSSNC